MVNSIYDRVKNLIRFDIMSEYGDICQYLLVKRIYWHMWFWIWLHTGICDRKFFVKWILFFIRKPLMKNTWNFYSALFAFSILKADGISGIPGSFNKEFWALMTVSVWSFTITDISDIDIF